MTATNTTKVGAWRCCRQRPKYVYRKEDGNKILYCKQCLEEAKADGNVDVNKVEQIRWRR